MAMVTGKATTAIPAKAVKSLEVFIVVYPCYGTVS
jgi:hypothetical protein